MVIAQIADAGPVFHPYGAAHVAVIALTVGLPVLFWATARQPGRGAYRVAVRYGLAGLLLANWILDEALPIMSGHFVLANALPMQLCDWATGAVILALVTRRVRVYEAAYFWGLAGTLQAIITPNLREGFPSIHFFGFFVLHSGIVVGVLYLTAVEGLRPRPWSIVRAMGWSEVYFAAALGVNAMAGTNYGFLSHRPPVKSLLDWLSSNHALYLVELQMLALGFYLALYALFWVWDLIAKGQQKVR